MAPVLLPRSFSSFSSANSICSFWFRTVPAFTAPSAVGADDRLQVQHIAEKTLGLGQAAACDEVLEPVEKNVLLAPAHRRLGELNDLFGLDRSGRRTGPWPGLRSRDDRRPGRCR